MNILEKTAIHAAQRAQNIQKDFFNTRDFKVKHKGAIDLVTQADLDSQQAIIDTIRKTFPSHQFFAEEDGMDQNQYQNKPTWIIDPLDGTTNFSKKFPYFAISIAFYDEYAVQFALIVNSIMDDWYIAHKGQGAFKNKTRLHVSSTSNLDQAFLVTGFPYDRRTSKNNNLETFERMELKSLCVRRTGAAALDLAYVAEGVFDGFWEAKLSPWDVCAGLLIVEEAGGKTSNFKGNKVRIDSDSFLATNGNVHTKMLEVLGK